MTPRTLPRVLVVGTILAAAVLGAAVPAFAREQDAGSEPGEPLSPLATLLIFGVLPVALFGFIALLVSAGSIARGPRYRPDRAWEAGPVSFGLPEHGVRPAPDAAIHARPAAALGAASARDAAGAEAARDAAGPAAASGDVQPVSGDRSAEGDDPGGGVSARW